MKTLRVFEAFSGIGSQRMSLENIGVPHEVVAISEIDTEAIKSYEAIHGKTFNLGDISKIDVEDVPEHDLFTYSFPCQDISTAGRGKGFEKGSGTRSSLLWECQRIIEHSKPKYLLLENVKNLVGKSNIDNFHKWLNILEDLGYTNYWEVLNAKDFKVPTSRERVYVISILGDGNFQFPKGVETKLRVKDIMDDDVGERYDVKKALRRERKTKYIQYDNSGKGHSSQAQRCYYKDSIMGTLPESNSGDKTQVCSLESRGKSTSWMWARRLTPKECWRLGAMTDEDFHKAEAVVGHTQLYRQVGNSIVVTVLEAIFSNLFKNSEYWTETSEEYVP